MRALSILERRMVGGYFMSSQRDLIRHAALHLRDECREVLLAYWMNSDKRLIDVEEIAIGSSASLAIDPRHLMRRAVVTNARFVAFVHNHPDGNPTPSANDHAAAEQIDQMLAHIGVLVLGNYVIGTGEAEEIMSGERGSFLAGADDGTDCNSLLEKST